MDVTLVLLQGQEECRKGRQVLEGIEYLRGIASRAVDDEALNESDGIRQAHC